MKNGLKITAMILAALMMISVFGACGSTTGNEGGTSSESSQTQQKEEETEASDAYSLPIVTEPLTLKFWIPNHNYAVVESWDDIEAFQVIESRTGIDIEWIHPNIAQIKEQFNIMLAGGDYPDIIMHSWQDVAGGLTKMLEQKIIIKLNDYIDRYAPDFKKVMTDNPDFTRQLRTDDKDILMFPQTNLDLKLFAYRGFQIRKDWLDDLGMKVPETVDEFYSVLKAFKENDLNKNGETDEIPFSCEKESGVKAFSAAWGLRDSFHPDPGTGKLIYGPIEPGYKDYLETMSKWYKEGLIDPEFLNVDKKIMDAKVLGNQVGCYWGTNASYMTTYLKMAAEDNPDFDIAAVPFLKGPAGKPYTVWDYLVRHVSGNGAVITSACKYPVEATKLLNFFYSEEGFMLQNWGIEGKSYIVENGKMRFTDEIINNPDKPASQVILKYTNTLTGFCKVMDFVATMALGQGRPEQVDESYDIWWNADKSLLMPFLSLTNEESTRYAELYNEINTYANEMTTKFVMGMEPLDKYEEFVATLKKMGIEEALKIQQDAYDRYNSR